MCLHVGRLYRSAVAAEVVLAGTAVHNRFAFLVRLSEYLRGVLSTETVHNEVITSVTSKGMQLRTIHDISAKAMEMWFSNLFAAVAGAVFRPVPNQRMLLRAAHRARRRRRTRPARSGINDVVPARRVQRVVGSALVGANEGPRRKGVKQAPRHEVEQHAHGERAAAAAAAAAAGPEPPAGAPAVRAKGWPAALAAFFPRHAPQRRRRGAHASGLRRRDASPRPRRQHGRPQYRARRRF
jgi:hypothetical protein